MKLFLKAISLIFHHLFVPITGTLAYFIITPKYTTLETQSGNVLPIFILSVIIPIVIYFILQNLGLASSILKPNIKELRYTVAVHLILLLMILFKVLPNNYVPELHYFFIGLIISNLVTLLLLLLNLKISLHLIGMGNILMFLICLSIHFEVNITIGISIFTLLTGMVATSRQYIKAHSKPELLIGFFIGLIAQLLTVRYWL